MALPGDAAPPDSNFLTAKITDLQRQLNELRAARSAEATTIGRGGITIRDGGGLRMIDDDGIEIMFIGVDSAGKQIIRIRREGGKDVLYTYSVGGGQQFWALADNNNNVVFADDAVSGQGLARPHLSIPWHPRDDQYGFYSTTTSGSFTTVDEVRWIKQHPKVNFVASTKTSDGASTGEWRIVQDGTVLDSGTVAASGTGIFSRFAVAGSHMSALNLDLQVRRLTGAGSIGALVKSITGEQS